MCVHPPVSLLFGFHFANNSAESFPSGRYFRMLCPDGHCVVLAGATWCAVRTKKSTPGVFSLVSKGILFPTPSRVRELFDTVAFCNIIHQAHSMHLWHF